MTDTTTFDMAANLVFHLQEKNAMVDNLEMADAKLLDGVHEFFTSKVSRFDLERYNDIYGLQFEHRDNRKFSDPNNLFVLWYYGELTKVNVYTMPIPCTQSAENTYQVYLGYHDIEIILSHVFKYDLLEIKK